MPRTVQRGVFRLVSADPAGSLTFEYTVGGDEVTWVCVCSPEVGTICALKHAQTNSTCHDGVVSPRGAGAVAHVELAPSVEWAAIPEVLSAEATTPTMTFLVQLCSGDRMVAVACRRCNRSRRIMLLLLGRTWRF